MADAVDAVQDDRSPFVPTVGERVWRVFWRLDIRRTSNGYTANAIGPAEVESWCRMSGVTLRPWELTALDEMEAVRIAFLRRRNGEDEEDDIVEGQTVTPTLVKALFG